jgi:hypothetical protein
MSDSGADIAGGAGRYIVETRLTAIADAIKSVRPDLQNFYASLTDEQKAKFNTMGPPPKATQSPQQRQSGDPR